jgi:hypothetical protein
VSVVAAVQNRVLVPAARDEGCAAADLVRRAGANSQRQPPGDAAVDVVRHPRQEAEVAAGVEA